MAEMKHPLTTQIEASLQTVCTESSVLYFIMSPVIGGAPLANTATMASISMTNKIFFIFKRLVVKGLIVREIKNNPVKLVSKGHFRV
ncbi:MAG TPA: hypothetical protein PKH58_01345 [Paludibacteraceae bacterium]|nr:hypothetical protein [Paludibacteraceae bacterium]